MRKRLISALLSLVMVLSLAVSAPLAVFADTAAVQNDPSDTKGVVRAKSAGSCYVYARAPNGIWKKLAVRVK